MKLTPAKSFFTLLLALGTTCAQASPVPPANLVLNGDFSTGLQNWTLVGSADNNYVEDGEFILGDTTQAGASLAQTIQTAQNHAYQLSFDLIVGVTPPFFSNFFTVYSDDTALLNITNTAQVVDQHYVLTFTSGTAPTTIRFAGMNSNDYTYLDNVSVTPVPEPAELMTLALGLGLLGMWRGRKSAIADQDA